MKSYLLFTFLFLGSLAYAQYNFEQIDIWSGSNGGSAKYLTEYNGAMYFQAFDLTPSFKKLYKTDGTESGTTQVAPNLNAGAGYSPESLTVFNGNLIFTAFVSALGTELYKTDGTQAGTILLKDIRSGASSGMDFNTNNDIELFVEFNDELYFRGNTGESIELWKTDGTDTGTVSVKNFVDVQTGAPSYVSNNDQQYLGVVFDNALYFTVSRSSIFELWKTDGTTAGTTLIRGSFDEPISNLIVFDDQLFFTATGTTGNEIWTTDGTTVGTQVKFDIFPNNLNPAFGLGSNPDDFFVFNNELFFSARSYDGVTNTIIGKELWKTNGSTSGLVKNINTTVSVSNVERSGLNSPRFIEYLNELYFTANDGENGDFSLWKTDGTEAGTQKIVAETDTSESFQFKDAIEYNGNLFYFNFQQLWVTDGTPDGTERLTDMNGVNSDILLIQAGSLLHYDNKLWFDGSSNANGSELTSIEDATLTIDFSQNNDAIFIYPNPVINRLYIKSNTPIDELKIYSLMGQKILESYQTNFVDLSLLESGYYLVKIVSSHGTSTIKFFKS